LIFRPKDNGSKEAIGAHYVVIFQLVAQEHNAQAIALVTINNNQIDTFFIRLIRGTTVTGLGCMKETDGPDIRPLLKTSKTAILEYLKTHNLPSDV
jgi:tRNA(Ile)-lysidine synthase